MSSSYIMELTKNENGGVAHDWVLVNEEQNTLITEKELGDMFVQFYFQCVLGNTVSPSISTINLAEKFDELLLCCCNHGGEYLDYVVKLCLQNRDIKQGKGLCSHSYMMLNVFAFYSYEKNLIPTNSVIKILKSFVYDKFNEDEQNYEHPYGSWKDIKYFLDLFRNDRKYQYTNITKQEIINDIICQVYIPQMIHDRKNMSVNQPISLCGKWLPRESSKKFGWIAKVLAREYYKEVYRVSVICNKVEVFKIYRKLSSDLNKYLDTTQIHMTGNCWDKINFNNVTSKTIFLNKNAFMNTKMINEEHRIVCKENFQNYIIDKEQNGNIMKNNNNVMPHDLVREALRNANCEDKRTLSILNMQWNGLMKNMENKSFLKFCYPCIDVSPSMLSENNIPLHCAIGLGLACAHLSKRNRAFTFSSNPEWIKYLENETFVERVYKTRNSNWGSTTNIHKLFTHILSICQNPSVVPQSDIDETSLVIFSDMQFDGHEEYPEEELFKIIRNEYEAAGYNNIPFLVFWNLRTTGTFPTIEKSKNMIKLSGNSASLLKIFMNTTVENLKKLENWDLLKQVLDNKRYLIS